MNKNKQYLRSGKGCKGNEKVETDEGKGGHSLVHGGEHGLIWGLETDAKSNLQENLRLGRSWEGTGRREERERRQGGEKRESPGEWAWPVLLQGTRRGPSSECVIIAFRGSAVRISSLPGSLVLLQSLSLVPPLPPSTAHTSTELRGFPEKMKSFLQDLRTTHKPGTWPKPPRGMCESEAPVAGWTCRRVQENSIWGLRTALPCLCYPSSVLCEPHWLIMGLF